MVTARRGITDEMGVSKIIQNAPETIKYRDDLNVFEVNQYDSSTYPGLNVAYRAKFLRVEQTEPMDRPAAGRIRSTSMHGSSGPRLTDFGARFTSRLRGQ